MNDVLQQELTGAPVTVRIRGVERPLAYPLHAVILYKQLTGDSLFVPENFKKIDLDADPDRWMKCLWAGMHQFAGGKWAAAVSLEELAALVDFSNAAEISIAMVRALTQSMPKARKEDALPNDAAPAEPETPAPIEIPSSRKSAGSTLEPAAVSDLVESSS